MKKPGRRPAGGAHQTFPVWAAAAIASLAPKPAFGASEPDAVALARHLAIEARIRGQWWDLAGEVWCELEGLPEAAHVHLLHVIVGAAKFASPDEFVRVREALRSLSDREDSIRSLAQRLVREVELAQALCREHGLECSLNLPEIDTAARAVGLTSWFEPRPVDSGFAEAVVSRKTQRDALAVLLQDLALWSRQTGRQLTHRAVAAIYNVAHDPAEPYTDKAVKTAVHEMRKRKAPD